MALSFAAVYGCTSVAMRSPENVKALAGTWEGNGHTGSDFISMTLVIQDDGSYQLTGSVNAKGTIKVVDNRLACGPFMLWVYDSGNSRFLQGIGNGARVSFSRSIKGPHSH
jgi:hypothetical protein